MDDMLLARKSANAHRLEDAGRPRDATSVRVTRQFCLGSPCTLSLSSGQLSTLRTRRRFRSTLEGARYQEMLSLIYGVTEYMRWSEQEQDSN